MSMIFTYQCTASTLNAILCFIDSGVTPSIAYDDDKLATALADKIMKSVGDKGGTQRVSISFDGDSEIELRRQFLGCCKNIKNVFSEFPRP